MYLAIHRLWTSQLAHSVAQSIALAHIDGVQLSITQLAQARALQVGLPQPGRRAIAYHFPQRFPDLVDLRQNIRQRAGSIS